MQFKNINFITKIINYDLSKKKVLIRTRFPPEPNGYLHIGHAKSIFLNYTISKIYNGEFYLRMDDTNPETSKLKYVYSIINDLKWLGCNFKSIRYSSDYFSIFYKYALILIKKGLAYVDELSKEEIKKYRGNLYILGKNSPYRNRKIERNLELFKKMRDGFFQEGQACLRAKIDMSSKSLIMRDPILYRIKFTKHYRTKKKWCVYPTYDFSHCIADFIEKITHSLCTKEFEENKILYNWILKNIDINFYPKQYEFSRLNIQYYLLSKRKLYSLVKNKIVKSWSDPRMPTLSGLRNKGYSPNIIKNFCEKIGITKKDSQIEQKTLERFVRYELDQSTIRSMAVINPIRIRIQNLPKTYKKKILISNHPKNKNMGNTEIILTRDIYIDKKDFLETCHHNYYRLTPKQEVKLKYSYIIRFRKLKRDTYGNIIKIYCIYKKVNFEEFRKSKKKIGIIHWLSCQDALKSKFFLYENLFNHPNPEKFKKIEKILNPNSLIIRYGFVNSKIFPIQKRKTFQFEREGYFIYKNKKENDLYEFHRIITLKNYNKVF